MVSIRLDETDGARENLLSGPFFSFFFLRFTGAGTYVHRITLKISRGPVINND